MDESVQEYFTSAYEDFMHKNFLMPTFGIINFGAIVKGQAMVIQKRRHLLRAFRRAEHSGRSLALNMVVSVEYTHPDGDTVDPEDFHRYLRLLINTRGGDFISALKESGGSLFRDINRIYTHSSTIKYDSSVSEQSPIEENLTGETAMTDEIQGTNEGISAGTIAIIAVAVAATMILAAAMFLHRMRSKANRAFAASDKKQQSPFTLEELSDFLGSYPVIKPAGDLESPSTWGSSDDASGFQKYTTEHINLLDVPETPRPVGSASKDDDSDYLEEYSPNPENGPQSPLTSDSLQRSNVRSAPVGAAIESSCINPTALGNSSQNRAQEFQKFTTEHINLLNIPETPRPSGPVSNDEDSDYMEGYSPNPENGPQSPLTVDSLQISNDRPAPAVAAIQPSSITVPNALKSSSQDKSQEFQKYTTEHINLLDIPETPRPPGTVSNDEDSDFLAGYSPTPEHDTPYTLTADSLAKHHAKAAIVSAAAAAKSPIMVEEVISLNDSQSTEVTANGKFSNSPKHDAPLVSVSNRKDKQIGDGEQVEKQRKKKTKKKKKKQEKKEKQQQQQDAMQSSNKVEVEGILNSIHGELDDMILSATRRSTRNTLDDTSLEASLKSKQTMQPSFKSKLSLGASLKSNQSLEPPLKSKQSLESPKVKIPTPRFVRTAHGEDDNASLSSISESDSDTSAN
eukprot:CAMPEP_0119004500 /NCGR_PEP_ID=MMETSP1176-20130426/1173_1 /TAXON_ID=265551 /ORGANISM="Synedropsis recta cf, Strain CCMP1620" /LENGTH=682 /DNA_ID=CAMNT_0006956207 /DNA_START=152 /DNA_END=2200 /DNA_ORIENTATION=-